MMLNWNGKEINDPVACAKFIAKETGLSIGAPNADHEAQNDEIVHSILNFFSFEVREMCRIEGSKFQFYSLNLFKGIDQCCHKYSDYSNI